MLILLLRCITFSVVTLWSILTRLIFSTLAQLLVLLLQGLKLPGEAAEGRFQQVAEAIRGCFEFLASLIMDSVTFMVTTVFDIVKDGVSATATGLVDMFGQVLTTLLETTKTSLQGSMNYVADMIGEISEMITTMAEELWNNYKEAVGYVMENATDAS